MFLDFNEISKVPFKTFLDHLNIPYTEKKNELRGECDFKFIVNLQKNLFFSPQDKNIRGSVINFLSHYKGIPLRDAAKEIKEQHLTEHKPKRTIPELELKYHKFLEDYGITEESAKEFEIGYCSQRGIMAGKIAVKCHTPEGEKLGYIGKELKKEGWFFPKGFKRPLYNVHRIERLYAIVVPSPLDVVLLHQQGYPAVSLLGRSMTEEQFETLKEFKRLLILHPEPQNVSLRLGEYCFIKAVQNNSVGSLEVENYL